MPKRVTKKFRKWKELLSVKVKERTIEERERILPSPWFRWLLQGQQTSLNFLFIYWKIEQKVIKKRDKNKKKLTINWQTNKFEKFQFNFKLQEIELKCSRSIIVTSFHYSNSRWCLPISGRYLWLAADTLVLWSIWTLAISATAATF